MDENNWRRVDIVTIVSYALATTSAKTLNIYMRGQLESVALLPLKACVDFNRLYKASSESKNDLEKSSHG